MGNYVYPMFDYHLANSEYTAQEIRDSVSIDVNPHRSERFFNFCHKFFRSSDLRPEQRIFVNQCGADMNLFNIERKKTEKRKEILTKAGFPENSTVLLYAGRLSPEKNIQLIPQIFGSLLGFYNLDSQRREYRLLIAGDGPLRKWLEESLEKLAPGKYKILGHIADREKLADFYANSDIFIHPNPREPFGIGPLEAMASGLPVVAPNSGGILSYADDENAWLGEAQTEDYFAAIRDVFNNEERRKRKIENALEMVRNYSWENSTDRLFAIYDEMYDCFRRSQGGHINESIASAGFPGTERMMS